MGFLSGRCGLYWILKVYNGGQKSEILQVLCSAFCFNFQSPDPSSISEKLSLLVILHGKRVSYQSNNFHIFHRLADRSCEFLICGSGTLYVVYV
jgi:hypothetical protein